MPMRPVSFCNPQYDGAGPIFGAESWLGMGDGLGLFGRATAGMLTGTMRAPFTETNNGGATVYADLRDQFALTVPVISLGVGIMYEYRGVFIRAGYEVTNFIGLFERPTFVDDFAQGKDCPPIEQPGPGWFHSSSLACRSDGVRELIAARVLTFSRLSALLRPAPSYASSIVNDGPSGSGHVDFSARRQAGALLNC